MSVSPVLNPCLACRTSLPYGWGFSENRPGHGRKKRYSTGLMNRYLAPIAVVLLLLAGCTSPSQSPKCDPFFGRTTIPPPPTGSAAGRCPDPYYQNLPGVQTPAPSPAPGCPPASSAAPVAPPAGPSTWAAPQGRAATASPPPANSSSGPIAPSQLAPRPSSTLPSRTAPPPSAPYGNPRPAAPANPVSPAVPPTPSSAAPPNPSSSGNSSSSVRRSLVGWQCELSWSIVTGSEVRGCAARPAAGFGAWHQRQRLVG